MSNPMRTRHSHSGSQSGSQSGFQSASHSDFQHSFRGRQTLPDTSSILARVEAELAHGYFEVPIEGITFRQLVSVYVVMLREGGDRMLGGLRSLFGLHPAH